MCGNKSKIISIIILHIVTLFGCYGRKDHSQIEVVTAFNSPTQIPVEISDRTLFFSKNVNDKSIVALLKLNGMKEVYTLRKEAGHIFLMPNDESILFIYPEWQGDIQPYGVYLYNLKTGLDKKLTSWPNDHSEIWLSNPSYSPANNKIIFAITWFETDNTGLAIMDIDGSNRKILKTNLPLNGVPIFSPDGEYIIVTCAGFDENTGKIGFQLCLLDKNGLYKRHITNTGEIHGSRAFTPDGKRIVYGEHDYGGIFGIINRPQHGLYIVDINGRNKTLLLDWIVELKAFSDDGKEIIFVGRSDESKPRRLYVMNIDGTNIRYITYFDQFLEEWYSDIEY